MEMACVIFATIFHKTFFLKNLSKRTSVFRMRSKVLGRNFGTDLIYEVGFTRGIFLAPRRGT